MKPLRYLFVLLIVAALWGVNFSPAQALTASVMEVTNFGPNPSSLRMFLYVPATVKPAPPILVAVHWCHGDGLAMFNGSQYASMADQYGYIVIYPSVTQASDGCFDVASSATLTHNGGSDSLGIVSMVTYVEQNYNGDPNQVYATGVSSGAMMTNVLLGSYPDVFKAGVAFAGVPFGCFAVNPDALRWSTACATGTVTHTPQEWGDIVRAAYPGYSGPRPRMQVWHGTNDEVLSYVNFGEEIKQWTNVLGASQTPVSTDSPAAGQTRTRYANGSGEVVVEAISMQGVSHNLPVDNAAAIRFFGLDGFVTPTPTITPGGPTLTPTRTPTRTLTPTITPTPAPGLQIKIQNAGTESNSLSSFNLQLTNTGATTLSNVTWRLYFTTENGNAASSYVLEKYYDQSEVATLSGPTLACGSTYYYTVSYGTKALSPGATWAYNTGFHLSSYASTYDAANDWWHTGYAVNALPAAFTITYYVPGYNNGSLLWGNEPNCGGGATNTPTRTPTAVLPTNTPTRTNTPATVVASNTPTRTPTRTATGPTPTRTSTRTPTRTPTGGTPLPTNTPTRTNTPATVVPTNTPTRTPTTGPTPTPTPTTGGACSPVTSDITAPFTFDGAGAFCWRSNNLGAYVNSWNTSSVTLNGVNITNVYVPASSYPAQIGGYWYVNYNSSIAWGHFETK